MNPKLLADGKVEYRMYGGKVTMVFNPKSPRYRYTVTDNAKGMKNEPVRGVTTLLKDIINKPELMKWPMNTSHAAMFGASFDEKLLDYKHDWKKALIQPDTPYTAEQLHETMLAGARAHTIKSDLGKDVGSLTHEMVEAYLKGVDYELDPEVPESEAKMAHKALTTFKTWWESLPQARVHLTEAAVYSRQLKYAGTMDLFAEINGKKYLLDLKTTNVSKKAPLGIYAEYFMQLGAYSYALREEHNFLAADLGIIRIGKDGRLNVVTAADLGKTVDDCERAFAFACRIHDWLEDTSKFLQDARMTSHLNPTPMVETELASNITGGSSV